MTPAADAVSEIKAALDRIQREATYRHIDPAPLGGSDLDALGEFVGEERRYESDFAFRVRIVEALKRWREGE